MLVVQPQDYFRELVTGAVEKQKLSLQPETEFYLVNLLHHFMKTDRLYPRPLTPEESQHASQPQGVHNPEGAADPLQDPNRQPSPLQTDKGDPGEQGEGLPERTQQSSCGAGRGGSSGRGTVPLALLLKEALEQTEPMQQKQQFKHLGDVSLYVAGYFQDSLNLKAVDVDYYIQVGGAAYQSVAARAEEDPKQSTYLELAEKFAGCVEVLAEISEKTLPRSEKDLLRLYEVWVKTRSDRAAKALQEAGILPNSTLKKNWH